MIEQPNTKRTGGRPAKFAGPSRPVTLTLPESTLQGLTSIDPDRGRAIVKLTEAALGGNGQSSRLVEVVEMAKNTGLIVIGPSRALRRIAFLHLVEVAPSRFLLALDPGNDFRTFEIAVHDLLDDVPESEKRERALINQLLDHIRRLRKTDRMSMAEILFVRLDERQRADAKSKAGRPDKPGRRAGKGS
jgi:hypothetical protein